MKKNFYKILKKKKMEKWKNWKKENWRKKRFFYFEKNFSVFIFKKCFQLIF